MAVDPVGDKGQPYRRWEPTTIEHPSRQQVKLPTAAEVERIQQEAHHEGFEAGHREGAAAGYAKGYAEGKARVESEVERLHALVDRVAATFEDFEQHVSQELGQDVLALTLDITKQLLMRALKVKPELLLPVVRAAIESLPQNAQHPHVYLHPQDAALVREMLGKDAPAGWKVVEDSRILPGGCRIETSTAEVDATLPSRWHRIASALGQDNVWLDGGAEN